jgi:hypothetical protein
VLATRDRDARGASESGMRVDIVEVQRFFEPGRLKLFEPASQVDDVQQRVRLRVRTLLVPSSKAPLYAWIEAFG